MTVAFASTSSVHLGEISGSGDAKQITIWVGAFDGLLRASSQPFDQGTMAENKRVTPTLRAIADIVTKRVLPRLGPLVP